jgi:CTP:molybdopterin cytidylyltransferase MocA
MGRPKAFLTVDEAGVTFVERVARTLLAGGAADALVVGRADDEVLRGVADQMGAGVRFVPNPDADTGQLSSIVAGLAVADRPGTRGILVTPVDLPLIAPTTVTALLTAFSSSAAPIVRATHGGRHGHPVVFARAVFADLRHADPRVGAKAVLRAHQQDIRNVEVGDPGVLLDVDTPEDYARLFSRPL